MKEVPWWMGLAGLAFLALALAACNGSGVLVGDDDDVADDDDDDDDDVADDDDAAPEGCGAEVEEALAVLADWDSLISCGAMYMGTAPDVDQTLSLSVHLALEDEHLEDGMLFEIPLGGVGAGLVLETGENLLHYDCNDALWLEEIVDQHWEAVSGQATVLIVEAEDEWTITARLELEDVVVADPENPDSGCPIPDTTWETLHIGWLPG